MNSGAVIEKLEYMTDEVIQPDYNVLMYSISPLSKYSRIAVIFALEDECRDLLEQHSSTLQFIDSLPYPVYHDKRGSQEIYILIVGVGRTAAAAATQYAISEFRVDLILNIGVVGAHDSNSALADTFIPTQVAYMDVDLTHFGHKFGQAYQQPAIFTPTPHLIEAFSQYLEIPPATLYTSEAFVTIEAPYYQQLLARVPDSDRPQTIFDMEYAAIAQVAAVNRVDNVSVKVISDIVSLPNNYNMYYDSLPKCRQVIANIYQRLTTDL